ncbi:MAG: hypothetical protein N3A69_00525 [Leptospiraceae bacterium]|nr:hypothetical protein [Leptospiraceae bacterium]
MSQDNLWYTDSKKQYCPSCSKESSFKIEYYHAIRGPSTSSNEFVTYNFVKKKIRKICEICKYTEETWDTWTEKTYPKSFETEFLKRRALYFKEHVPSMVQEVFEDYFKRKPNDLEMHFEYGKFLAQSGKLLEAYSELKKALNPKKINIPVVEDLVELLFTLLIAQSEIWYEKKIYENFYLQIFTSYEELQKELNFFLKILLENFKENLTKLCQISFKTAYLLEDSLLYSDAVPFYKYVIQYSSSKLEKSAALLRLALVNSNLLNYEEAFQYLNESQNMTPNVLISFYRAKIYYKMNEIEKANLELESFLKTIESRIQKDPKMESSIISKV